MTNPAQVPQIAWHIFTRGAGSTKRRGGRLRHVAGPHANIIGPDGSRSSIEKTKRTSTSLQMGSSLQQRYSAYVEPIWYIGLGIQGQWSFCFNICALILLISAGFFSVIVHFMFDNPRQLLDISRVKYAVFAEFWARVGELNIYSLYHLELVSMILFGC